MRPRAWIIVIALAAAGCSPSAAAWSDVAPRSSGNGAYVDLFASFEHDSLSSDFRGSDWSDLFFREKLTFFSNGYFYHPRFMQYHLSLAGALKQEDFTASYLADYGWRHGTGYEYDARMYLLPEHPYNLELFAVRFEPLVRQQASTQTDSLQTNWGGVFRYRDKPWFFGARYTDSTTQTGIVSSNVEQFGADGQYFRRFMDGNQFSLNANYNPTHFSNTSGIDGDTAQYSFGGLVDLQRARLTSTYSKNDITQEDALSRQFESDQEAWYEVLNLYLPQHFRSDISYRIQNYENTVPTGIAQQPRTLSDINKIFQFDIIHRLYESLDSTFSHVDNTRTSAAGDTDYTSNALNFSYNKIIPKGRFLAGFNLGRSDTDNRGKVDIVDETHPGIDVPVPGTFLLAQPNVDPGSILIYARSPVSPFNLVLLVRGSDYLLNPIGNSIQVQVVGLPPPFLLPGTFDFTVSYSLTTGTFDLRTDDIGYNVSVDLLNSLVTPYYGFLAIRSTVLSGAFPGVPLDSTTRTLGVRFYREPLRGLIEFQNLQWDVSPYHAWRAEIQYVGSINPTTRCYAIGTYVHKYFPQGTSLTLRDPYTDDTASISGSLQKQVPESSLLFALGGSISSLRGRVDGSAYSLNSSLTWRVGKMDLTAGASAYQSSTQVPMEGPDERMHQYYYFNLRRTFF